MSRRVRGRSSRPFRVKDGFPGCHILSTNEGKEVNFTSVLFVRLFVCIKCSLLFSICMDACVPLTKKKEKGPLGRHEDEKEAKGRHSNSSGIIMCPPAWFCTAVLAIVQLSIFLQRMH